MDTPQKQALNRPFSADKISMADENSMIETHQSRQKEVACSALMMLHAMESDANATFAFNVRDFPLKIHSSLEEEQADLLIEVQSELTRLTSETVQSASREVCRELLTHLSRGLSARTHTIQ